MTYPTPGRDSITIPPSDEIAFQIAFLIKAETGVDIYTSSRAESLMAVAWWYARTRPEYKGITYDQVRGWDLSMLNVVSRYTDAAAVVESASLLPVEPDLVIPEDGAGFPVVDPPADRAGDGDGPFPE